MHLEDYNPKDEAQLEAYDAAILTKMHRMIKECTESFEKYDYSKTKNEVERFFWQNLCDFYLEVAKDRLYNPDKRGENARKSAQYTLYRMMITVLKMFAPIMPHITEEVYQKYFKKHEGAESIHISEWPKYDKAFVVKNMKEDSEGLGFIVDFVVEKVRKAKSDKSISLKEPVKKIIISGVMAEDEFEKVKEDIKGVTHAEDISYEKIEQGEYSCEVEI